MKKKIQTILPWLIAAGIFYFLFNKIPPADVWRSIVAAHILLFMILAALYFVLVMIVDCVGLQWVLSRFSTPVTYQETILMRGATYLLMLINYNLAQGGMAFYLKKTHQAPLFRTLGAIVYLTLVDLTLVFTFSFIAVCFQDVVYRGISLRPLIFKFGLIYYALLIVWFVFWKNLDRPILLFCRRVIKPLEWVVQKSLFFAFKETSLKDVAKVFLLRLPMTVIIMGSFYFVLLAFRSHVALEQIFLYVPIMMFAGTLPITPAGSGTTPLLAIEFFGPILQTPAGFSSAEILLASTLLWMFVNLVFKTIFGFYCLRQKSKSLFEGD